MLTRTCQSVGALLLALVWLTSCGGGSGSTGGQPPVSAIPEQELSAPATVNLATLPYDNAGLAFLRSSNYFPGVRTLAGLDLYAKAFANHRILRVNTFDRAVVFADACLPQPGFANCVDAFQTGLEESRAYLTALIQQSPIEILAIDIFRTPRWLSTQPNASGTACGGGQPWQSYLPKDITVWKALLARTVTFAKSLEALPGGPKIVYQFWNEPDLSCNWQGSTAEFLALYKETAPYLKSTHPAAWVGGSNLEHWNGRLTKDGASRPQNLNFDLIDFAQAQALPLDLISFHYFSQNYRADFLDGMTEYRRFLDDRKIPESSLPIYLSEWLPQRGAPSGPNPQQAADAGNFLVAMMQSKPWGQGGVPWQDYAASPSEQWGIVTFPNADKKPIFHVYEFFDQIARTGLGATARSEDIKISVATSTGQREARIGERRLVFAKRAGACHRVGIWNRVASAREASVAFLFGEGITLGELQTNYGTTNSEILYQRLEADIVANRPFASTWTAAFAAAQVVHAGVDDLNGNTSREFSHVLNIEGGTPRVVSATSHARNGQTTPLAKVLTVTGQAIRFSLRPAEVLFAEICL